MVTQLKSLRDTSMLHLTLYRSGEASSESEVDEEIDITGHGSQSRDERGIHNLMEELRRRRGGPGMPIPFPPFSFPPLFPFPFPFPLLSGARVMRNGVESLHMACSAGDEAKVITLVNDEHLDINAKKFMGLHHLCMPLERATLKL